MLRRLARFGLDHTILALHYFIFDDIFRKLLLNRLRDYRFLTLKSQSSRQGKAKGKDKKPKKGKKSASPAVTPTAGTPVPELTPEEIARQKMLERANMECTSALLSEDRSFNLKLSVVKVRLVSFAGFVRNFTIFNKCVSMLLS